jgi:hypothetical protein
VIIYWCGVKSPKGKEGTTMMNWYMNAENHEEDYEELMEPLKDLAEEDEEG